METVSDLLALTLVSISFSVTTRLLAREKGRNVEM